MVLVTSMYLNAAWSSICEECDLVYPDLDKQSKAKRIKLSFSKIDTVSLPGY